VWDTHVADRPPGASDRDGGLHRGLASDALQDVVRATTRQPADLLDGRLATRRDGLGRAHGFGQLQSVGVVARGDDAFCTQPSGRLNPTEPHGPVADDDTGRPSLDPRRDRRVVAGPHHVGQRENRSQHCLVGAVSIGDSYERAICVWRPNVLPLGTAVGAVPAFADDTGAGQPLSAELTLPTAGDERGEHPITGADRPDVLADLLDDPHRLVANS
jgi:hypothetical protein